MALMPDNASDLIMSPVVIPLDENFLPAFARSDKSVSPARAYLRSLNSSCSRQTMASFLNIAAGMLSTDSLESCNWSSFSCHNVMAFTELQLDTGRATATVDT